MKINKRLVILSGPSCAGKTPLLKALARVHPEIKTGRFLLYNSREPRSIEKEGVDFYFRSEKFIRELPKDKYIVSPVRHLWQAISLEDVKNVFKSHNLIVVEIYPTLAKLFQDHPLVKKLAAEFQVRTVFLQPITEKEILSLQQSMGFKSPEEAAAAVMTPKLLSRYLQQGKLITPQVMEDIRIRTSTAFKEIQISKSYTHVILNYDGEDSVHWRFTPPIGEAGKTLETFVGILTR